MAKKKTTRKTSVLAKKQESSVSSPKVSIETKKSEMSENKVCCLGGKIGKKFIFVLLSLVIIASALGYFFKDRFLVAVVNGKPIFRYSLSQFLIKSSGKDALENLIVEKLVQAEVKKNNVSVGDQDIENEINKIKEQLGTSVSLENALSMQGMTLEDFREQIKTRLQVYKILENEITVSDEEVNQYLQDNASLLTGTTDEEKKVEASAAIKEQKMNERIQTWVNDLLSQAKITRFLK